jgi:YfiH family protein
MLERFEDADGFTGYRSPLLASVRVPHLFTTRRGGGGRELDLGRLDERTRERLCAAAGAPASRFVRVHQVHGARVIVVGPGELPDERAQADALVTELAGVLIGVHVADCVPVLLARSDGRRVAVVHAGWRGLVAGVIPRALEGLGSGAFLAALGPCIASEAFEVGPEVAEAFVHAGLASAVRERARARPHVDLRAAAEEQLRASGVELIDSTDRCTYRDGVEFYSYRRDVTHGDRQRTGRLGAWIGVAPG